MPGAGASGPAGMAHGSLVEQRAALWGRTARPSSPSTRHKGPLVSGTEGPEPRELSAGSWPSDTDGNEGRKRVPDGPWGRRLGRGWAPNARPPAAVPPPGATRARVPRDTGASPSSSWALSASDRRSGQVGRPGPGCPLGGCSTGDTSSLGTEGSPAATSPGGLRWGRRPRRPRSRGTGGAPRRHTHRVSRPSPRGPGGRGAVGRKAASRG